MDDYQLVDLTLGWSPPGLEDTSVQLDVDSLEARVGKGEAVGIGVGVPSHVAKSGCRIASVVQPARTSERGSAMTEHELVVRRDVQRPTRGPDRFLSPAREQLAFGQERMRERDVGPAAQGELEALDRLVEAPRLVERVAQDPARGPEGILLLHLPAPRQGLLESTPPRQEDDEPPRPGIELRRGAFGQ